MHGKSSRIRKSLELLSSRRAPDRTSTARARRAEGAARKGRAQAWAARTIPPVARTARRRQGGVALSILSARCTPKSPARG